MYRGKAERKYYKIRADVVWGLVLCVGILIMMVFWGNGWLRSQEVKWIQTEGEKERIEVRYDNLKSELQNVKQCYLCGDNKKSLMGYYRKFDTIGLISLNKWYVLDFSLGVCDGEEIGEKNSNNVRYGNTGELSYSVQGTPSRGMAEIDVTLPENYKLDIENLQKNLCQGCLDKIADSLKYWKWSGEAKEAIPICLVDFKTLEIYSLQDYYRSYFIRDYFVEMEFEGNKVEVEVFYLPGR